MSPSSGKTVRFDPKDSIYRYPGEDSPSPEYGSGVEGATGSEEDNSPPSWVYPSLPHPTQSLSTASTGGLVNLPSPPAQALDPIPEQSTLNEEGILQLHPAVVSPKIPWDIFKRPTHEVIPELISCGNHPFITHNPQQLTSIGLVHPHLHPWPIIIDLIEPPTVEGVYAKIYHHMNEPLSDIDLMQCDRERISSTYTKRCREQRLSTAKEIFRKIDCLGFARVFCGLIGTVGNPGRWELVLLSKIQES